MTTPQPSRRAIIMIEHFEVGGESEYVPRPVWPGGASGLTIGVGYDLGYASTIGIARDWHQLPQATLTRLQSYAGRTGASARQILAGTHDLVIPFELACAVFETRDIPRIANLTAAALSNTDRLSPDSFGALVSLVFNRGASMTDSIPGNRLEMRQIRDAMSAADFDLIPGFIRSMKRLWQGRGLDGLLARRDAEADLFASGLITPPPGEA